MPRSARSSSDDVDIDAFADELFYVAGELRRLGLRQGAKTETGSVLPLDHVIDGITSQQDVEIGARAFHRVRDPHDRVVLLFDGGPIGRLLVSEIF